MLIDLIDLILTLYFGAGLFNAAMKNALVPSTWAERGYDTLLWPQDLWKAYKK